MSEQARAGVVGAVRRWRWWAAAVLLTVLTASLGCNPIQMTNWALMPFMDTNVPPTCSCKLTVDDRESKVCIIVAHRDQLPNLMFKNADNVLAQKLTTMLEQRYKENGDKIKIVSVGKAMSYAAAHPDWMMQSKQELGKKFGADFIIYLELGPMTLYEEGSNMQLFRGKVDIDMTVFDCHAEDGDETKWSYSQLWIYPSSGPEDAGGGNSAQVFRQRFLDRVAKDLVPYFAAHPPRDKFEAD